MEYKVDIRESGEFWYNTKGELHREGDLPAVTWPNGTQIWYRKGLMHRDNDQPAMIEADGTKSWYKNGQRHRENGPAEIQPDGSEEYWLENEEVDKEDVMEKYEIHGNCSQPGSEKLEGTKINKKQLIDLIFSKKYTVKIIHSTTDGIPNVCYIY